MSSVSASKPDVAFSASAWFFIFLAGVGAIVIEGTADVEMQSFFVMVAVVCLFGVLFVPRAARKDHTVSRRFLMAALAVFVAGSFVRYQIIQIFYNGVSDAKAYFDNGMALAPAFRHFDFTNLIPPFTDTAALNYASGFLYTVLPPSLLAGFVAFAGLAFIGCWHFYRAFRVAFPDGNHKLYGLLIFFLPSFWYWTTSLGKDAPVVMGLGIATYGFALAYRKLSWKGIALIVLGLLPVVLIRAPIAAALAVAGSMAYAFRPTRSHSAHVQALSYVVVLPALAFFGFLLIGKAQEFVGATEGVTIAETISEQQTRLADQSRTGSNFLAPNPLTVSGFPVAVATSIFRPLPFEAKGLLPVAQSMEGVALLALFTWKFRESWRGVRSWRQNAMVILVVVAVLILSLELAALANFGLLARQRTQLLPFLLMLPCMVKLRSRRASKPAEALSAAFPAWAPVSPSLPSRSGR